MMGFFPEKKRKFTALPQTPNSTPLNNELDSESLLEHSTLIVRPGSTVSQWILIPLIIFSIFISHIVGIWIGSQFSSTTSSSKSTSTSSYINEISNYSPMLEDIDITYATQRFNGSLLKETIYRQGPSPEVDAAWAKLGVNYRALSVPAHLAQKAGLAPDQVKINQKYGGGYPANVEGLHHLHCLNLLRQGLYYNVDYYREKGEGAFKNSEMIVQKHVSHCLDVLRQQLMCTVDIGVLGQVWIYPKAPEAYVDFNTEHKCRNFDAIRKWAEMRQLSEEVPNDWLEPPKIGDRIYEEMP